MRSQRPSGLQYAAAIVSASVILLPLIVAKEVEFFLRSKPDQADVASGLVDRPVLIAGGAALAICVAASVILIMMVLRLHGPAHRAWLVLGVQLALGAAYMGMHYASSGLT